MKNFGIILVSFGMYLRTALDEVGWIDEERYRFYHADVDLCLKMWQAGYEVNPCPDAFIEHHPAPTEIRKENIELSRTNKDADRFIERWGKVFEVSEPADFGLITSFDTISFYDLNHTINLIPAAPILTRLFLLILNILRKFYHWIKGAIPR